MLKFIIFPLAGAFIGWLTNFLAIKLIFHPLQAITIPIVNYRLQGLIPKRRMELAKSIGQVIQKELLSIEDLTSIIKSKKLMDKLSDTIGEHIQKKLDEKVPGFLPLKIKGLILEITSEIIKKQTPQYVENAVEQFASSVNNQIDISLIVENKINNLEIEKFEAIIFKVAKKELRHIEFLGGLLGFIIGVLQILLLLLMEYYGI